MKLYYFPSPNPQKVRFALLEMNLECEIVPLDLLKREQRQPEFLALNPVGRVPVLTDGDLTLWESHAIIAYLGEKTGKMWPTSAAGRADALRWLFFLSGHISPAATDLAFNRIAVKLAGGSPDEEAIARGEKALPDVIRIVEGQLANRKWLLGDEFTLVECAYGPVFNVIEKAGFSFGDFPKVRAYLDAIRSRTAWKETPKLPGL
ncbi:MAG TPA: glutathione S-transferase family protein [Candidatus Binataceae bacterium]